MRNIIKRFRPVGLLAKCYFSSLPVTKQLFIIRAAGKHSENVFLQAAAKKVASAYGFWHNGHWVRDREQTKQLLQTGNANLILFFSNTKKLWELLEDMESQYNRQKKEDPEEEFIFHLPNQANVSENNLYISSHGEIPVPKDLVKSMILRYVPQALSIGIINQIGNPVWEQSWCMVRNKLHWTWKMVYGENANFLPREEVN